MPTASLQKTSPVSDCNNRSVLIRSWLATYAETYRDRDGLPRDVSDGRLGQIYERALSDILIEQLAAALDRALKTCRFFPTVADIRAGLDEVSEKAAQLKYERTWLWALEVARRFYFADLGGLRNAPPIPAAIKFAVEAAGGWGRLHTCKDDGLVWCRKTFLERYGTIRELREDAHLLGDAEARGILNTLQAGPPPPPRKQLPSANEVLPVHAERTFLRMGSEPNLPEERKLVNPIIEITDEVRERIEAQKQRLKEWQAARQKSASPAGAEQPVAEVLA